MTDNRNPRPAEMGVLFNFTEALDPEVRGRFLRALSLHEIAEMSASEEEFRVITGEDMPENFLAHKPVQPQDVTTNDVTKKQLEKRLQDILEAFPVEKSLEGLKRLGSPTPRSNSPKVADLADLKKASSGGESLKVSITIEQLKEKAGLS